MSKKTLDMLIMKMVADASLRERLNDPAQFSKAIEGLDLTEDEIARLKGITSEKKAITLPYAQKLNDRLAK